MTRRFRFREPLGRRRHFQDPRLDDEAEMQAAIAGALDAFGRQTAEDIQEGDEPNYEALAALLLVLLLPRLTRIATRQAQEQAQASRVPFDPADVAEAAAVWAQGYAFSLVRNLTDTTRKVVQRAIAQYALNPQMTAAEVAALLEPAFGAARAELIAITEVTRAHTAAASIHQQMLQAAGVRTVRVWETVLDERVCPICRPLHRKRESDWGAHAAGPPAHARCRCAVVLERARAA